MALIVVPIVSIETGCQSFSRGSQDYHDWSGEVFGSTPVTFIPFVVGWAIFGVVSGPFLLFSLPLNELLYPEPKSFRDRDEYYDWRRDKFWGGLWPTLFMSGFGGTLLSLPFFPFGIPFMFGDEDDHDHGEGADHSHGEGEDPGHSH